MMLRLRASTVMTLPPKDRRERPGVDDVPRRGPAAPRRHDGEHHVLQPAYRVRVRRAHDPGAGGERVADMLAAQVEAVREAVDLERDPLLQRHLVDALQIEGVLGTPVDVAALRVAETADVGVAER